MPLKKCVTAITRSCPHLYAASELHSVLDAQIWTGRRYLPVVDIQERLVGCLSVLDLEDYRPIGHSSVELPVMIASEFIHMLGDLAVALFGSRRP